jgi:hypothetical protein
LQLKIYHDFSWIKRKFKLWAINMFKPAVLGELK